MKDRIKSVMSHGITGLERVKGKFQLKPGFELDKTISAS
jgi:hypothetical protein